MPSAGPGSTLLAANANICSVEWNEQSLEWQVVKPRSNVMPMISQTFKTLAALQKIQLQSLPPNLFTNCVSSVKKITLKHIGKEQGIFPGLPDLNRPLR